LGVNLLFVVLLLDLVDIIDENGTIAMNVWGNNRQIYFDSRGLRILHEHGQEKQERQWQEREEKNEREKEGEQVQEKRLEKGGGRATELRTHSSSSPSFTRSMEDGSLLRCVSKDDVTREILHDGNITHRLLEQFPKPAVGLHQEFYKKYQQVVSQEEVSWK
jgi:hypothetical protein